MPVHYPRLTASLPADRFRGAACVGMDPRLFDLDVFPSGTAAARAACARCPVLAACRDHATTVGEIGSFWAGRVRRAPAPIGGPAAWTPEQAALVHRLLDAGVNTRSAAKTAGVSERSVIEARDALRVPSTEQPCEGPGCAVVVPAGRVRKGARFCSRACSQAAWELKQKVAS